MLQKEMLNVTVSPDVMCNIVLNSRKHKGHADAHSLHEIDIRKKYDINAVSVSQLSPKTLLRIRICIGIVK